MIQAPTTSGWDAEFRLVASDKRLAAIAGTALFAIIIPMWIYLNTISPFQDAQTSWPFLLIIELSAARLVWLLGGSERRLYEMVFWVFIYVFAGVAPFVQSRWGVDLDTIPHLDGAFHDDAILIILVSCFAWIIGSSLGTKGSAPGSTRHYYLEISQRRAQWLFLAVMPVSVYYVMSVGLDMFFENRLALSSAISVAWPSTAVATAMSGGVAMGLLVTYVAQVYAMQTPKASRTPFTKALIVLNLVVLLICVNPISSPRYVFGTVLLSVIATTGVYATLRGFRIMIFAAVLGFIFLLPIADIFRRATPERSDLEFAPMNAFMSGDFDTFAQTVNAADYVNQHGISWGEQITGALLLWVPRSIWPDKPVPTTWLLADYKSYDFRNLSAPLWTELLVDGGWPLLVFGMLGLGYFFRRMDRRFDALAQVGKMPGVLGSILPFYMVIIWRGSLMGVAAGLMVILVGVILVSKIKLREFHELT